MYNRWIVIMLSVYFIFRISKSPFREKEKGRDLIQYYDNSLHYYQKMKVKS